uniref:SLH domain-containing protein n=1 Tax=Leersia perrieri TaxID=77586 RepID=A0A0D9WPY7_9ORYZ
MATATAYALRLSPPPSPRRHHTLLLPHPRSTRGTTRVSASWASPDSGSDGADDGVGGWWLPEQQPEEAAERRRPVGIGIAGSGRALAVGLGASAAIALAGVMWHSPSSRKCFYRFVHAPLHYVQEKLSTRESKEAAKEDAGGREQDTTDVSRTTLGEKVDAQNDDSNQSHMPSGGVRISFRAPVDPVHEEAFSILKKLQIIEKDASSSDFCTRREFARWFIKLYSKIERKRMRRIIPNIQTSGPVRSAFDDIDSDDPDFLYIQCIVSSKLSTFLGTSASDSSSDSRNSNFLPDSYLSRFDLVNWKALVEHPFPTEVDQKMLSKSVRILDLSSWPDVSLSMLIDLMDDEQSIVSKVFGNTRRLQPHKPVMKAQAAAALTSGRMEEVIRDELNRLEAENQSQLSVMGEIMEELINRGDIKRYWEEKMKEEENRELAVDKHLQNVLQELTNEKTNREKELAVLLKERTALEHQNQELVNLRSEIDGMYDRLAMESLEVMTDEQNLEKLTFDVSRKHQAVSESKSYLEAEKEALTMLRSWVEEEAARVHERAEVLEKAVRRWRIPAD